MAERFVLAVDFGSTKAVCTVYGAKTGAIVGTCEAEVPYRFPGPGRCEMDPEEVWRIFLRIVRGAISNAGVAAARIACMGICVQRNSVMLWDRASGQPLSPFLSWRDTRASGMAAELNASLSHRALRALTRLLFWLGRQPRHRMVSLLSFKGAMASVRLCYLLQDPEVAAQARAGSVCAGCLETWLLWRLTGGREFVTEISCASVTGLFDIFSLEWSGLLCSFLGIPLQILPEVRRSDALFGLTRTELFGAAIPVRGVLGDQQAALLGEGGAAKLTLGTLTSVMANTASRIHPSIGALFPVALWRLENAKAAVFGVEGVTMDTGPTLDWLVELGLLNSPADVQPLLEGRPLPRPGVDGEEAEEAVLRRLCFVPALSGLQLPAEDHEAGCLWVGMRRNTSRAELVRAALLGLVFQTRLLLERFQALSGANLEEIRTNGGLTRSAWLMQTLANATNVRLLVAAAPNASLEGVAAMAGAADGLWLGQGPLGRRPSKRYEVEDTAPEARLCWDERFAVWLLAVERAKGWHG